MTTREAEGYNGWANRETWNVQLWITDTQPLHKLVKKLMGNDAGSATTGEFAYNLEQFLWILWEGNTPANCDLRLVNWVEIAMSWQENYKDYLDELDGIGVEERSTVIR